MLSLLGTLAWYAFLGLVIFYSFTLIPYLYTFFTSPLPSQLSGPKPSHWFFGEILTLQRELPYRPHIRWAKEFGGMVLYRTFFQWKVLVSDPEAIRQILVTKAQSYPKPEQFKLLKTILGKGLVTSEGETHTHDRKHISPAFHFTHLKKFAAVFSQHAVALANKWESDMSKDSKEPLEVDMHHALSALTLDIMGTSGFKYNFNTVENDEDKLYKAYTDIFSVTGLKWTNIARHVLGLPWPSEVKNGLKVSRDTVDVLIKQRRAQLESSQKSGENGEEDSPSDLLGLMLMTKDDDGNPIFSQERLVDHTLTFLLAGHETTANSLCWLFYLLTQNPRVTEKLQAEVDTLGGRPPTYEELKKLNYLNAVIREALRLYPAVPLTIRQAAEDDKVKGVLIPKGTMIFMSAGVQGRLPSLWGEDADEFRPERFLDPSFKEKRFAWFPFIAGPRSCIGQNFALQEMGVAVSHLVQKFNFELSERSQDVKPKLTITLRPYPDLYMKVTKRS